MSIRRFVGYFKEPAFINALQAMCYLFAGFCGFLAASGGVPHVITFQLGSVLSVIVGGMLMVGGLLGAWAVYRGLWGVEQISIWITGLGYGALLIPTIGFALLGKAQTPTIWLIVALEFVAIIDSMKRYRRIDWAYLDPTK